MGNLVSSNRTRRGNRGNMQSSATSLHSLRWLEVTKAIANVHQHQWRAFGARLTFEDVTAVRTIALQIKSRSSRYEKAGRVIYSHTVFLLVSATADGESEDDLTTSVRPLFVRNYWRSSTGRDHPFAHIVRMAIFFMRFIFVFPVKAFGVRRTGDEAGEKIIRRKKYNAPMLSRNPHPTRRCGETYVYWT